MTDKKQQFTHGVKDGIPIGLGYFAVSFTFGMAATKNGIPIGISVLISATNLTSAGQFAALSIIAENGGYFLMLLTQLVINLRYCLMSLSLTQKMERTSTIPQLMLVSFGVTDEIFGISAAKEGAVSPFYNYGAMSVAIPGWVLGTFLGALSGKLLPAMFISALSVAIYGMFLAIIIPPAKKDSAILIAVLLAMALASCFTYLPVLKTVSSGMMIIIVTVLVSAIVALIRPVTVTDPEGEDL